jgi:hypothetical protein
MILRRLVSHLKQQHWTSVVIDLLIVVLGVFIGLQAQEWSQVRDTAARQEVLARELSTDLRADLKQLDSAIVLAERRYGSAQAIVQRVNGWTMPHEYPSDYGQRAPLAMPATTAPDSASDALFFAQRYSALNLQRRTFDTLLATGDISFVRRPGLAESLRAHYGEAQAWSESEKARQRPVQLLLEQAFARHGLSPFEQIDWKALDAVVAGDPELQGLLKAAVWEASVQHYYLRQARERTTALIADIEKTP